MPPAEAAKAWPAAGTVPLTPSSATQEPLSWAVQSTEPLALQGELEQRRGVTPPARLGMIAAPMSTAARTPRRTQVPDPRAPATIRARPFCTRDTARAD
jgi:hypothetical protein